MSVRNGLTAKWKSEQSMGLDTYMWEFWSQTQESSPAASVLQKDLKTEQVQMKYKTQAEHYTEARGMAA